MNVQNEASRYFSAFRNSLHWSWFIVITDLEKKISLNKNKFFLA